MHTIVAVTWHSEQSTFDSARESLAFDNFRGHLLYLHDILPRLLLAPLVAYPNSPDK